MLRRGRGILLHITSLLSPSGIGGLGTGAYAFADFLSETKQSFWQVLPLNPTTPESGYSPYLLTLKLLFSRNDGGGNGFGNASEENGKRDGRSSIGLWRI
jgi:hypothetical protein